MIRNNKEGLSGIGKNESRGRIRREVKRDLKHQSLMEMTSIEITPVATALRYDPNTKTFSGPYTMSVERVGVIPGKSNGKIVGYHFFNQAGECVTHPKNRQDRKANKRI